MRTPWSRSLNVYTDPSLLDVAGALEALPNLSLDGCPVFALPAFRAIPDPRARASSGLRAVPSEKRERQSPEYTLALHFQWHSKLSLGSMAAALSAPESYAGKLAAVGTNDAVSR